MATKRLRPVNRKHEQLMQRARCAAPGQRQTRGRELVRYVARLMAPRVVKARGMQW